MQGAPADSAALRKRAEVRNRLVMGPILILFVLCVFTLDEWIGGPQVGKGVALPPWLHWADRTGLCVWSPGVVILPVALAIALLAAREMATLLMGKGIAASKRIMSAAAIAGLLVSSQAPSAFDSGFKVTDAVLLVSTAAVVVLALAMIFYARNRSVEGVVAATGGALLAFVYLGLMFGSMLAIRREHSAWVLLWVLLVTKACDIGAWFTGRALGRHKLIPWLSPGKTWEGLAGGLVFSSIISVLGAWILDTQVHLTRPPLLLSIVLGVVFGVVGQAGDLVESVFKRDAGKKDSGQSVPGMGGVLDVLDSTLLVAPLAYWGLRVFEANGYLIPV
jgi:phosphatidate cytidylyltransferase